MLPVRVLEEIAKLAEASILHNIKHQQQADGAALKVNSPAWREHKRKKRRPQLSLVNALHRFVRGGGGSWATQIYRSKSTIIVRAATNELAQLSEWVQGMGYVGWHGVNRKARAAMMQVIRDWVRDEFKRARAKQ